MCLNKEEKKLVEDNLGLAYHVAYKFFNANKSLCTNKGIDVDELSQVALEKLCVSVKNYDSSRGKASTYLYTCMYFEVSEFTRTFNQVKIPRWDSWIGDKSKNSKELVSIMYGHSSSFDSPIAGTEDLFFSEILGEDEFGFKDIELNSMIEDILNMVNKEDRYILEQLLKGKSQQEIGNSLCTSQSNISRKILRMRRIIGKKRVMDWVS